MRIGELAGLIGVSTRTVRHYHHLGLLPEPVRQANGYRTYRMRDAVLLARIKRLTELGLSLDEVRDVLADDQGRDLREVLTELDADLARQEEWIRRRRTRLAELLKQDTLHPDAPVSDDMAAVLSNLPLATTGLVAMERDWLALLDSTMAESSRREITELMGSLASDPQAVSWMRRLYEAMDELVDAARDDPRVPVLAEELAAGMMQPVVDMLSDGTEFDFAIGEENPQFQMLFGELAPAQAEVLQQAFTLLAHGGGVGVSW